MVARDDNVLVGYLLGAVTAQGLAYAHLIAVRADARNGGVGRRLYDAFLDGAERQGAHRVEAITTTTNAGSIAFHERLGFTAPVVTNYAGPDAPRILFSRPLPRVRTAPVSTSTQTLHDHTHVVAIDTELP